MLSSLHPSGMRRSVEKTCRDISPHPVRDASLTGCAIATCDALTTERCNPDGLPNTHIFNILFATTHHKTVMA
jgi:hypothetical protein